MDVEAGIKDRLSCRHVTEGQMRAPTRLSSYGARWIGSHNSEGLVTVLGCDWIVMAAGRPSNVNLICARRLDRKTEWRVGATNPTSDERTKHARQFGQTFSGTLTHTGGMFEKLRYADG
jgi:hypothetical protein